MSGFDYFKKCITVDYTNFEGRARRSEFWYFMLFSILLSVIPFSIMIGAVVSEIRTLLPISLVLFAVLILGTLLPGIAVSIRRLHDIGKSGWFYLLTLIPLGNIVLFVFFLTVSDYDSNEYGPNPRKQTLDIKDHLV